MARKVFTSFYFDKDYWRAQQIRNIGAINGNSIALPNRWEEITKGGERAIKTWIDANMSDKSCLIVLVGHGTAQRKWIQYEIKKAWADNKAILGIHVHNMKHSDGSTRGSGSNPFSIFGNDGKYISSYVTCHDPQKTSSKSVYKVIQDNLEEWIEEAIKRKSER